ncbi:MAG: DUF4783 domain-containing protein [Bacteroidales bacterium]|nr:DUF4783 domain-containing protein [Bacteroidales bacterium]MDZ4203380.1 DUF4783 domain-containing protein [Bacteroidales bacterium]
MKKFFFLLTIALLFIGGSFLSAQETPKEGDSIIVLLRTANAKELARHFNASVQLTLPDNDGRFNRTQAELIMRVFFSKYPPQTVTLNHQGASNDGSLYFIGDYKSGKTKYRTYFLLKKVGANLLIHQLRIELDD